LDVRGEGLHLLDLVTEKVTHLFSGEKLLGFLYSPVADGEIAYFTQAGRNSVAVISTLEGKEAAAIVMPAKQGFPNRQPTLLASSGDGTRLFTLVSDGDGACSLVVISVNSYNNKYSIVSDVPIFPSGGDGPTALFAGEDGSVAFVLDRLQEQVWPVRRQADGTYTAGTPVPAGSQPSALAISPDGGAIYILNKSFPANAITRIETRDMTARTVPLPETIEACSLNGLAVSIDGSQLFATDGAAGAVRILDAVSLRLLHTISLPAGAEFPHGIAASRDGARVFVANALSANLCILEQVGLS
jgi:DNA-binding beta-propeller fold protein YncE